MVHCFKMQENDKKLDILLINPSYCNQSYALNMPLGLCYIASALEKEGFKVKILDLQIEKIDLKKAINSYRPWVIGISGTTQTRLESFKIAKIIKSINSSILNIYGGYHATATADETLKNIDSIDIIVRGEGENIVANLLKEIKNNQFANLNKINGISYRQNGAIYHNHSNAIDKDLDGLPYRIRHFVDVKKYRFYLPFQNKLATTIISSRGCTMDCIFCSAGVMSGGNYVTRSALNVCDEIQWIKNTYGIESFFFCDNDISLNRDYIHNLCDEILARKLNIIWECKVRVDGVDLNILKKMRSAGCYIIAFGVESASERVLKTINKNIKIENVEELFRWADSLGLLTKPFFILGHPTESYKEALQTLDFIERHKRKISIFELYPCVTIYPGTKIEEFALEEELLPKDFSWSVPYYCRDNISLAHDPYIPILIQPQLGFRELKKLYYSFLRGCVFKPRFLWEKIRRAKFQTQASKYFRVIKNITFTNQFFNN
jgi:anaerobic magnesium-protoporphyrin IX monomethyl ester cyclase